MHAPNISKNLLSISQFAKENKVYFKFHANKCLVKSHETKQVFLEGKLKDSLYAFDDITIQNNPFMFVVCILVV